MLLFQKLFLKILHFIKIDIYLKLILLYIVYKNVIVLIKNISLQIEFYKQNYFTIKIGR